MKMLSLVCFFSLSVTICNADVFTNKDTGEVFNGYATQIKRGSDTLVRTGYDFSPKYINLKNYKIEQSPLGRRNQINVLSITGMIEFECETQAFAEAIETASNAGPVLIVINIDTPGGRHDLMEKICNAISAINNCTTAAFVCGGDNGGAYSAGAYIALACDYIYMAPGTAMGAAASIAMTSEGAKDLNEVMGQTAAAKHISANRGFIGSLAEQAGRPALLAEAMVDMDIDVVEVNDHGKRIFVTSQQKKKDQELLKVLNEKGKLLTLSAREAVRTGMADKVANTQEDIIADFTNEHPRIVRDAHVAKARAELNKANREFVKLIPNFTDLSARVRRLNEELSALNERRQLMLVYGANATDMAIARRQLSGQAADLCAALEKLGLKVQKALKLKHEHPDLSVDEIELQGFLDHIGKMYADAKSLL
jgi:ATP-dependent protease ClpP protease subunit